ncbi:MAG TPA: nucleoside deaminase [Candidatus Nanopelagicales bacterium]
MKASPADEAAMRAALAEAALALPAGDVPIGALVLDAAGAVLGRGHNRREAGADPTAHAEVLALRDAAHHLGRWRLDDCLLVVTLEPCPMCAGALWASRIGGVVFGAENADAGALGTLYHLGQDPRLNHEFPVRPRVLADDCGELLRAFFADRR